MKRFLAISIPLIVLATAATTSAEEKSMWQKFVNFFSPSPTLEGEGPLYDQLKELDSKITKTEGKYSRERRPGNKARLKKELEELREQRNKLVEKIKAGEALSSSSTGKEAPASSSQPVSKPTACAHDTIFVKDTVIVHDTLYVIVADKPASAAPADSTPAPDKN
jgi:hypothetical protein